MQCEKVGRDTDKLEKIGMLPSKMEQKNLEWNRRSQKRKQFRQEMWKSSKINFYRKWVRLEKKITGNIKKI